MANLQKISSKISSIQTTKKITKAMELIATSKLWKVKNNFDSISDYFNTVVKIFHDLEVDTDNLKIFKQAKKAVGILYIVITSDLGLCGAYNSNIIKLTKDSFTKNDFLIILGNKGMNAFKSHANKIIYSQVEYGDHLNYSAAKNISKKVIEFFLKGYIQKVKIVYSKYINSISYTPRIGQIFPFHYTRKNSGNRKSTEYEPSSTEVFERSLPLYVSTMIYGAITESKVCEISSRRIAMENASNNAQDLIDDLKVDYNKERQAKITQEIAEIVAGSSAEENE